MSTPNDPFDSEFAKTFKASAQQIWLAGLGALAKAQEEGGKVFEALVKDGTDLQKKTQSAAEEKIAEVSGRVADAASEMQAKAGQQWDKLEGIFEERTARALKRLGVPSAQDVAELSARVEALSQQVAELSAATRAARKGAAQAAKKTAAKKTSAKPSAKRAPRTVAP